MQPPRAIPSGTTIASAPLKQRGARRTGPRVMRFGLCLTCPTKIAFVKRVGWRWFLFSLHFTVTRGSRAEKMDAAERRNEACAVKGSWEIHLRVSRRIAPRIPKIDPAKARCGINLVDHFDRRRFEEFAWLSRYAKCESKSTR